MSKLSVIPNCVIDVTRDPLGISSNLWSIAGVIYLVFMEKVCHFNLI